MKFLIECHKYAPELTKVCILHKEEKILLDSKYYYNFPYFAACNCTNIQALIKYLRSYWKKPTNQKKGYIIKTILTNGQIYKQISGLCDDKKQVIKYIKEQKNHLCVKKVIVLPYFI